MKVKILPFFLALGLFVTFDSWNQPARADAAIAPARTITDPRLAYPPPMTTLSQVTQVMAANKDHPVMLVKASCPAKPPVPHKETPDLGVLLWWVLVAGVISYLLFSLWLALKQRPAVTKDTESQ